MDKTIDLKRAKILLPKRKKDSNKGTFGKILNIAGSRCYQGAAYLSSISALRTGAGYVTLACPDCIVNNIASLAPELTFMPLSCKPDKTLSSISAQLVAEKALKYDAVSLGCGLTQTNSTVRFLKKFLDYCSPLTKLILDADGINCFAKLLASKDGENIKLPEFTIMTPHPMELSRLLKVSVETIQKDRAKYAQEASEKFNCTIVLKGHKTIIADKDSIYINHTGNSALAKAGTGDVLTGIISAFVVQNMYLADAARLGVYIHGLSGDILSNNLTEYSVLATDLIKAIPISLKNILNS
ncbi:MAG: NAD(P)H-hydrate dehydratase [Candidatus Gastranaerophilales bacterium]|nr:NAD(P)H-hydrate dehydratase [Candidatus Gastranaerophilales bacterium]